MSDLSVMHRCAAPLCSKEFERAPGPGRPKLYCSAACNTNAYRTRKFGRVAEELAGRLVDAEYTSGRRLAYIADLERELADCRARLAELHNNMFGRRP